MVLWTAIANGSWEEWKLTTCFIVDSCHYNNHKASDALCAKYCNPAPLDGSAPNLVQFSKDKYGVFLSQLRKTGHGHKLDLNFFLSHYFSYDNKSLIINN